MPSLTKVQPAFILAQGAIELDSGTASAPSLKFATSSATGMFSPSTGALAFSTGSTQNALSILANGNVGIGTTNPTNKLDVVGSIIASGSVSAAGASGFYSTTFVTNARNPIWRFANADEYGLSYFQGSAGVSPAGGGDTIGFHFGTPTAAGSLLQLNNGSGAVINGTLGVTGNVGIGTASAATKLEAFLTVQGQSAERYTPVDVLSIGADNPGSTVYGGFGQGLTFKGRSYNSASYRVLGRIS